MWCVCAVRCVWGVLCCVGCVVWGVLCCVCCVVCVVLCCVCCGVCVCVCVLCCVVWCVCCGVWWCVVCVVCVVCDVCGVCVCAVRCVCGACVRRVCGVWCVVCVWCVECVCGVYGVCGVRGVCGMCVFFFLRPLPKHVGFVRLVKTLSTTAGRHVQAPRRGASLVRWHCRRRACHGDLCPTTCHSDKQFTDHSSARGTWAAICRVPCLRTLAFEALSHVLTAGPNRT